MRTKTIEVFQYAELSDKAKAKARDWYREASAGGTDFAEFTIDDFVKIAGFCGWSVNQRSQRCINIQTKKETVRTEPDISWSLGYMQSDFAAFDGSWQASDVNAAALKQHAPQDADLHKLVDRFAAVAARYPEASGTVRYHHYYGVQFETDGDFDADDALTVTERNDWKEATRALNRWLYDSLRAECDYQNSDEAVAETIEANEYEFDADGDRFRY